MSTILNDEINVLISSRKKNLQINLLIEKLVNMNYLLTLQASVIIYEATYSFEYHIAK